ncbi:ArfGap-domain-containing protein [Hortaea werneckii]|nr:ArfGap-domain-containing protein [Hortaea werneckii]
MASALTKRQQARNERALHDLLRSVPGNDRCADCGAKNPGWASWNLGIFLCMRCAGLHRKLGTHLSKVKSLSMDSWTSDQVESMKKTGNLASNQVFNPKSVRADIPIDADEVEGAMERYIRRKYEHREFAAGNSNNMLGAATRQNTGSTGTGSWSEEPPPLPPKPGKKFGFSLRSASSSLPRPSRQERNFTPPLSPTFSGSDQDPTSPREMKPSNKPSQVFGMRITSSISNNFDQKLATLRDMGFSDSRRNSDVLKNVNGSLDKAVEALVRLEGSKPAPRTETPAPRTLTPVSMGSQGVNGISVDKTRQAEAKNRDPWEVRETSPQRAATQPLPLRSASAAPAQNSWNPFMSQMQQPQQSTQGLESTFQNMQLSQPGPPQQQQQQYMQPQQPAYGQQGGLQNNPFQPAPNPWDSLNLPQQQPSQPDYMQQHFQQPTHTTTPQPQISSNPFLRKAQSQTFPPSNIWDQPITQPQQPLSAQQTGNPFGNFWQSSQQPQQQAQSQPQYQQQPSFLQQPTTQSPAPIFGQQQNYFSPPQPQQQPQQQQHHQQTWPPSDPRQQTQSPFTSTSNPWQQPPSQPQPQSQPQNLMPQMTGLPPQQHQQSQSQPQPQFQPQQPQQQQPQDNLWSYTPKDSLPSSSSSQPARYDKASILAMYGSSSGSSLQPVAEDARGGAVAVGGGGGGGGFQEQQQQQQVGYNPFATAPGTGSGNANAHVTSAPQPPNFASHSPHPPPPSAAGVGAGGFATPAFSPQQPQPYQQQQQQPGFAGGGVPGPGHGGARHVSHESAAFVTFPASSAGEGGRASPDAFAGLSAGFRFR